MIPLIQAHDARGRRHELRAIPTTPGMAVRLAARAAVLLGQIGTPGVWDGGRLVVIDAADGRLLGVVRVPTRPGSDGQSSAEPSQTVGRIQHDD